ncbi:MAG: MoxR family ATPase [Thermomicrobiales bacterium]
MSTTTSLLHAHAGRTFDSVDALESALRAEKYIADRSLATTLYLMLQMRKPLLLEGEAGVGKTEIAKVLATILDTPLIRLQCYEGLDANAAIYEWDYPRQMLYLQTIEATGDISREQARRDLFSKSSCSNDPCCRQSTRRTKSLRSCSSTRSTGPIRSWKRSCSSCCLTSR